MKRDESEKLMKELLSGAEKLRRVKGSEYTKGSEDVLANFKRIGDRLGIHPLRVLMVYLIKQIDSLENCLGVGSPESEPVESRIQDALNYLLLAWCLYHEEEDAPEEVVEKFASSRGVKLYNTVSPGERSYWEFERAFLKERDDLKEKEGG